jgi:hypothetical protein
MKANLFICCIAALFVIFSSGCGEEINAHPDLVTSYYCEDVDSDAGPTEPNCAVPPSTFLMQALWAEAQAYRWMCPLEAYDDFTWCIKQQPEKEEECFESLEDQEMVCEYYYATRANKIPLRECGAVIFEMASTPLKPGTHPWVVTLDDTDGDGVSNWHEYWMGLNPCEEYSFGECNPSDGELDYDVDGIPNGEDEFPLCNPDDPAGWQSDCA